MGESVDKTSDNGFKLQQGRFILDILEIRKKFFTIRVVRH